MVPLKITMTPEARRYPLSHEVTPELCQKLARQILDVSGLQVPLDGVTVAQATVNELPSNHILRQSFDNFAYFDRQMFTITTAVDRVAALCEEEEVKEFIEGCSRITGVSFQAFPYRLFLVHENVHLAHCRKDSSAFQRIDTALKDFPNRIEELVLMLAYTEAVAHFVTGHIASRSHPEGNPLEPLKSFYDHALSGLNYSPDGLQHLQTMILRNPQDFRILGSFYINLGVRWINSLYGMIPDIPKLLQVAIHHPPESLGELVYPAEYYRKVSLR